MYAYMDTYFVLTHTHLHMHTHTFAHAHTHTHSHIILCMYTQCDTMRLTEKYQVERVITVMQKFLNRAQNSNLRSCTL